MEILWLIYGNAQLHRIEKKKGLDGMEKTKIQINNTGKRIVVVVVITIGIYLAFRYLLSLVLPFLIAGIVSIIYYPFLRKLCKKTGMWEGKKKKYFLIFAVVILYALLFLLVSLLAGYLFGQGQSILLNFPFYQAKIIYLIKCYCCEMDGILHVADGASYTYIEGVVGNTWSDSLSRIIPKVTSYSVQMAGTLFGTVFSIIITVIATFFMIQDYDEIREKMLQSVSGRNICRIISKCKETLKAYAKAQGFIMLLDGTICTLAFFLIDQPYFLVFGPLVAVVDALPFFGAGLILIPYMLILLLTKEAGKAVVLLLAYLGCLLIRQITEPRIIGNKVGIKPLYTIISMYVGYKLFGVPGFLLGPVGVLIGKEIYMSINNQK